MYRRRFRPQRSCRHERLRRIRVRVRPERSRSVAGEWRSFEEHRRSASSDTCGDGCTTVESWRGAWNSIGKVRDYLRIMEICLIRLCWRLNAGRDGHLCADASVFGTGLQTVYAKFAYSPCLIKSMNNAELRSLGELGFRNNTSDEEDMASHIVM